VRGLTAFLRYKRAVRAVVQRVSRARVTVREHAPEAPAGEAGEAGEAGDDAPAASGRVIGRVTGEIERGLLVLLGAAAGDGPADLAYIVDKVTNLRIFPDDAGKMNRSVKDIGGGVLVVSQFTLLGDARQGRRPSFIGALEPAAARELYEQSLGALRAAGVPRVEAGEFAADMAVELLNDGPVTILLDSRKGF